MKRKVQSDEVRLVKTAAACDEQATLALCRRFAGAIRHAVSRFASSAEDREDLHSEVVVRLLADDKRALRRWQPRAPFAAYVSSVAAHHCIDWMRGEGRLPPTTLDPAGLGQGAMADFIEENLPAPSDGPEAVLDQAEFRQTEIVQNLGIFGTQLPSSPVFFAGVFDLSPIKQRISAVVEYRRFLVPRLFGSTQKRDRPVVLLPLEMKGTAIVEDLAAVGGETLHLLVHHEGGLGVTGIASRDGAFLKRVEPRLPLFGEPLERVFLRLGPCRLGGNEYHDRYKQDKERPFSQGFRNAHTLLYRGESSLVYAEEYENGETIGESTEAVPGTTGQPQKVQPVMRRALRGNRYHLSARATRSSTFLRSRGLMM